MIWKHKLTLLLIIVLAVLTRFYLLTIVPNSVSADEASFGYNAYSLWQTGRDEFGQQFPLSIRSFDDYKNPVFAYYLAPFVGVFGLSDLTMRLAASLVGVAAVVAFFLLTQTLSNKRRLPFLAAFFAAISPWLIQYSRVAIDMEIALFFSLMGVWAFLKGRQRNLFFLLAAILFGISFYSYHSSKVWIALFVPVLFLFNFRLNRYLLAFWVILSLMIVPYFYQLLTLRVGLRPYSVSIFSQQEPLISSSRQALEDQSSGVWGYQLIHNRRLTYFNEAVEGFLRTINPTTFFSQNGESQIPSVRFFYLWQLPLIFVGLFSLATHKKIQFLLLLWFFIALLPGALTFSPPFDRRVFLSSYPIIFWASWGLDALASQSRPKIFAAGAALLIAVSFLFYLHTYFIHGRDAVIPLWGNGMKQLVQKTRELGTKYEKIIVSTDFNQPLTFFLYYTQYSPEKYLSSGGTVSGGFLEQQNKLDNYEFRSFRNEDLRPGVLLVLPAGRKADCFDVLQTIEFTNGTQLGTLQGFNPKSCLP